MTPEGAVVKECLEYLKIRGIFAYRQNTGAAEFRARSGKRRFVRFGALGASDIIGIIPGGRFIAVECKAGKGKLSDLQKDYLKTVTDNGGLAIVAKSYVDIEKALRLTEEKCKRK